MAYTNIIIVRTKVKPILVIVGCIFGPLAIKLAAKNTTNGVCVRYKVYDMLDNHVTRRSKIKGIEYGGCNIKQ